MSEKNIWEELNRMPDPLIDYENDTDLELEALLSLDWQIAGTERSAYSITWVDTYTEPSGKYAKRVYNDGYVEFYELAD